MTEDKLYKIIKEAIEDSYIPTSDNSTIEQYLQQYLHSIDWLLEKIYLKLYEES
jgi:hypothetical protein